MQQDRDRRHAHPPESYLYRSSPDYVSSRSPPYSERMATQYQQSARLPEPYFVSPKEFNFDVVNDINTNNGTPYFHREVPLPLIRSVLERSHTISHMFADSSNLLQELNPFLGPNLETIPRLRGVVHIGTQHVTTTYAINLHRYHQLNIETPQGKNPISMLIARIPEDWSLGLGTVGANVYPISLLQGLWLSHMCNSLFI